MIYYYLDEDVPLFALLIYGKGEQADLTPEQCRLVADFVQIVKAGRRKRRAP